MATKRTAENEQELFTRPLRNTKEPIIVGSFEPSGAWSRRYKIPRIEAEISNSTDTPNEFIDPNSGQTDEDLSPLKNDKREFIPFNVSVFYPIPEDNTEEIKALCKLTVCELCNVNLTSEVMAKSHYVGKAHNKKVKVFQIEKKADLRQIEVPLFCKYCNKSFSSPIAAADHYKGKKHQNVMKLKSGDGVVDDFAGNSAIIRNEDFRCNLCDIWCTDQKALSLHFDGAKHKKKVSVSADQTGLPEGSSSSKLMKKEDVLSVAPNYLGKTDLLNKLLEVDLSCLVCCVTFIDILELVAHYRSKDHNEKVQSIRKFDCDVCNDPVQGVDEIVKHLKCHYDTLLNK